MAETKKFKVNWPYMNLVERQGSTRIRRRYTRGDIVELTETQAKHFGAQVTELEDQDKKKTEREPSRVSNTAGGEPSASKSQTGTGSQQKSA